MWLGLLKDTMLTSEKFWGLSWGLVSVRDEHSNKHLAFKIGSALSMAVGSTERSA